MTKIRKQKKKKTFKTNINRKRLRNKLRNVGNIQCPTIKKAWNDKMSARSNLKSMGLAYDPNEVLKIPSYKEMQKQRAAAIKSGDFTVTDELCMHPSKPAKTSVVEELELAAKAPRQHNLRLPKAQVDFITYLMDKYGCDYKAMARDKKNYYQDTWKQIRAKIKKFTNNRKELSKFVVPKGILDSDEKVLEEAEALLIGNSD